MARKNREVSATDIYHVILRGVNKQRIFENQEDFEAFLRMMRFVRDTDTEKQPVSEPNYFLYAYCMMDNHVHLLLQPNRQQVGQIIKRITTTYAIYFNNTYERVGHLFQDRFKSEVVETEDYFFTLIRYIHRNPVEAGICQREEQYPYSSCSDWIYGKKDTLCCFPDICDRLEMIEEESRYQDALEQWEKEEKGIKPTRRSMNLLAISPEQMREFVRGESSHAPEMGLIDKLRSLTRDNDSELCRLIRMRLDWQTEQEKDEETVRILLEMTGAESISTFQRLEKNTMRTALAIVRDSGVSQTRLSRLTGIPRGIIRGAKVIYNETD